MRDFWEETFRLMQDHGHDRALDIVDEALRCAGEYDSQEAQGWIEIAECLNALARGSRTVH